MITLGWVLAGIVGETRAWASEPATAAEELRLTVEAGPFDRRDTPVHVELPAERLSPSWRDALAEGPLALELRPIAAGDRARPVIAQAERVSRPDGSDAVRLIWVLEGEVPGGASRTYRLVGRSDDPPRPWSFEPHDSGSVELRHESRLVWRYNAAPVSHPEHDPVQDRDAYLHPVFAPSGALITGDYSSHHPHHRGFFLAYARVGVGAREVDFWNIQRGLAKVHCDGMPETSAGPVTAALSTRHRWELADGQIVLRERWDIEVYDIPGAPYWLFDLTSTQRAEHPDEPFELLPHRYGGMAYRGPEPFLDGPIDVRTSEGAGRREQDQKPARWVDLTGPIAPGSDQYAGAMIADHPANLHHPNVARIHPTTLPFFCYVPAHRDPVTITSDEPTVFRYRVLLHDGRPDTALNERLWRDLARPPRVRVAGP